MDGDYDWKITKGGGRFTARINGLSATAMPDGYNEGAWGFMVYGAGGAKIGQKWGMPSADSAMKAARTLCESQGGRKPTDSGGDAPVGADEFAQGYALGWADCMRRVKETLGELPSNPDPNNEAFQKYAAAKRKEGGYGG